MRDARRAGIQAAAIAVVANTAIEKAQNDRLEALTPYNRLAIAL